MSDSDPSSESTPVKPWLEVVGSRYFMDWLAEQQTSLAFSTYQTGKMFFIGRKPNNQLGVFEQSTGRIRTNVCPLHGTMRESRCANDLDEFPLSTVANGQFIDARNSRRSQPTVSFGRGSI
jgi:hypothetical protein